MNRVILHGRLTRDPEIRQTQSGISVCRFSVAVNRPYRKDAEKQEADFIDCTAWRSTADFVGRYFQKGSEIIVEGQLRNNNYTDNNGVKHYSMNVLIDAVHFAGSKLQSQQDSQPAQQRASGQANQQAVPTQELSLDEFEDILSSGQLPF